MNKRIIFYVLASVIALFVAQTSQARYLDVNTGRFMTMDTYGGNNEDPASLHKYLYAADDPVNRIDPSGHDTLAGQLGTIGGLSILAGLTLVALSDAHNFAQTSVEVSQYFATVSTTLAAAETETLVRPKSKAEVREKVREETKDDSGAKIFYHGTSTGAFADYASGQIDFTKGNGSLGAGFYTTGDPNGLEAAAPSAYSASGGGVPIIMIFTMRQTDFFRLRGLYVPMGSIESGAFSPGFDYVCSPYGFEGPFPSFQFNWQPGSLGSELLLTGFKGFVPLPTLSDWSKN